MRVTRASRSLARCPSGPTEVDEHKQPIPYYVNVETNASQWDRPPYVWQRKLELLERVTLADKANPNANATAQARHQANAARPSGWQLDEQPEEKRRRTRGERDRKKKEEEARRRRKEEPTEPEQVEDMVRWLVLEVNSNANAAGRLPSDRTKTLSHESVVVEESQTRHRNRRRAIVIDLTSPLTRVVEDLQARHLSLEIVRTVRGKGMIVELREITTTSMELWTPNPHKTHTSPPTNTATTDALRARPRRMFCRGCFSGGGGGVQVERLDVRSTRLAAHRARKAERTGFHIATHRYAMKRLPTYDTEDAERYVTDVPFVRAIVTVGREMLTVRPRLTVPPPGDEPPRAKLWKRLLRATAKFATTKAKAARQQLHETPAKGRMTTLWEARRGVAALGLESL